MRTLIWFYLPIEGDRLRALKTQLPLMHLTLIPTSKKRFSLCRQPFNREASLKAMGMPERVDSIVCLSLLVTRNETSIDHYCKKHWLSLIPVKIFLQFSIEVLKLQSYFPEICSQLISASIIFYNTQHGKNYNSKHFNKR